MSKYCMQCGKEIPQNSKNETCEKCQNKKYKNIREIGEVVSGFVFTVVSIGLFVITKGKFGSPKT